MKLSEILFKFEFKYHKCKTAFHGLIKTGQDLVSSNIKGDQNRSWANEFYDVRIESGQIKKNVR